MNQETTFFYKYSAKENKEIQEIRNKYLPGEESRLEELKRLDHTVETAGIAESLCFGIGGALVFGCGLCFAMQVIGNGVLFVLLGVLLAVLGSVGMFFAYPVYRSIYEKTKAELTPRILSLSYELSGEKTSL